MKPSTRILLMQKRLLTPIFFGSKLALWLDVADSRTITFNGFTVSDWRDKSANRYVFSQPNKASQPTYNTTGLNGLPALDWGNVANDKQMLCAVSGYRPRRYYGVAKWDGPDPFTGFSGLLGHGPFAGLTSFDRLMTNNSGQQWFAAENLCQLNGGADSNIALPTISNPFVFATMYGPSSGRTSISVGNDLQAGALRGWIGKISELIAVNFVPTTLEHQQLTGYFAHRWRLTANLANNHPFKFRPPYM